MENAQNMEVFKDIKGYPDYQISSEGRVWSDKSQRYLSPVPNSNGYLQIKLIATNGKRKAELIHRLMALAFIPNPENKPEVNHINHLRDDNRVENLEWVTKSENNTIGRKRHYTHSKEWFEKRHSKKLED